MLCLRFLPWLQQKILTQNFSIYFVTIPKWSEMEESHY